MHSLLQLPLPPSISFRKNGTADAFSMVSPTLFLCFSLFVPIQKIHLIGKHTTFACFLFHACLIMASSSFSICIICATKAPALVKHFLMPPSSQMAIQLTLILISCSLYSMYSSSSSSSSSLSASSSLALLVLVISTCISLLFSNFRHLLKAATTHKGKATPSMEEAVHQEKSITPQDEVTEDAPEDLMGSLSDSSECTTNDEECTEEGSISEDIDDDDESLIEISLVDGHYVGAGQDEQCAYKKELLAEFFPDLVLDKRDFIDILSEISEEDSLIEIDIARGSIKCSNLSIKT
ncbi:hypothetical protein PAHAL_3G436900 [Panicum hallii]|uniref:Uncharacterized protein n=1 Tax=Panicum hallii TaxID=206008 RepID=A0A2T8KLE9_9POAL|nr:uncharacterized protein LOC112887433 [Panicum hallii]PVH62949.1 hypothetical protein PAHAL_3G436900 [Panicum hallii]